MDFGENLKYARKYRDLTQKEIADKMGIAKATYSGYEINRRFPDVPKIKQLCQILRINADWLLGFDVPMEKPINNYGLTARETAHIKDYRLLNDLGKAKADERVHELTEVPKYIDNVIDITPELADCVYYDNAVSAGNGLFLSDEIKTTIRIKKTPSAMSCDYAVRVSGDSMQPRLFDGDVILVKSMPCVDIGEIGIYVINGEAFVKKYGGDRLISLNHDYEPIVLNEYDCVVCLGKVLGKAEF